MNYVIKNVDEIQENENQNAHRFALSRQHELNLQFLFLSSHEMRNHGMQIKFFLRVRKRGNGVKNLKNGNYSLLYSYMCFYDRINEKSGESY